MSEICYIEGNTGKTIVLPALSHFLSELVKRKFFQDHENLITKEYFSSKGDLVYHSFWHLLPSGNNNKLQAPHEWTIRLKWNSKSHEHEHRGYYGRNRTHKSNFSPTPSKLKLTAPPRPCALVLQRDSCPWCLEDNFIFLPNPRFFTAVSVFFFFFFKSEQEAILQLHVFEKMCALFGGFREC